MQNRAERRAPRQNDGPQLPDPASDAAVVRQGGERARGPEGYRPPRGRPRGPRGGSDQQPQPESPAVEAAETNESPQAEAQEGEASAQSQSTELSTTPKSTAPKSGGRERIQLQIAREAGFSSPAAPDAKKANSQEASSEKSSNESAADAYAGGGRIQEQLLKNGAGFSTGLRESSSSSNEVSEFDKNFQDSQDASGSTQFQSASQQLTQLSAEQALSTLSIGKK